MIGGTSRPFSISRLIVGLVLSIGFAVSGLAALPTMAASNINRSINYQGRLLTSGGTNVADGNYPIKFSVYNVASGGTALWTASGTTAVPTAITVQVTDGLFSVLLGDTSFQGQNAFDIDWNQDGLYLGVTISGDTEMTPRKRLSAVPYAFNSDALQGQYASSSNISGTSGTGTLFALNQASSTSASATRTTLLIETAGTSNFYDYLLRARPTGGADVFSISRQGNVTSTGNFVLGDANSDVVTVNARFNTDLIPSVDLQYSLGSPSLRWLGLNVGTVTSTNIFNSGTVSSTNLIVSADTTLNNVTSTNLYNSGTVSTTQLFVNGTQITGGTPATTATLQTITNNGATTTNLIYAQGGVLSSASSTYTSSLTVLGDTALQLLTFTSATGSAVTTTNLFVSGTASTSQLFVNGQTVCLTTGINCPTNFITSSTWQFDNTSNIAYLTTSTQDVLIGGGNTTSSALFVVDYRGNTGTATNTILLGGVTTTLVGIGTATPAASLDVVGSIRNLFASNQAFSVVTTTSLGGEPTEAVVVGRYAYVANRGSGDVFQVIDVSNPLRPAIVGSVAVDEPISVVVAGQFAYVVSNGDQALKVINLSNPTAPLIVASIPYSTSIATAGENLLLNGKTLYARNVDKGITVFDLSNASLPTVVTSTTSTLPGSMSAGMAVQGTTLFVGSAANYINVYDITNPLAPVLTTSTFITGADGRDLFVRGRYLFIAGNSGSLYTLDISNPAVPVLVNTVTGISFPTAIEDGGRYIYYKKGTVGEVGVIDAASATNAFIVTSIPVSSAEGDIVTVGKYLLSFNGADGTLSVIDMGGIETSSLLAAAAELGALRVMTDASVNNRLHVGTSLDVGSGGILSLGALGVYSSNTTSTIAFAVSSTAGEFSNRLTVGGVHVCLQNGTNCPGGGGGDSFWEYDLANDVLYTATPTQDVLLGGNTSATAGFIFDYGTAGTSTVIIGGSTNTNLLVGTTTYSGGLDAQFNLSGNDLLVQGQIGSIGGIFSATSVVIGSSSTFLSDGALYKTTPGDFTLNLNDAASNWRVYTAGAERLTVASSGNVGIGLVNPQQALDVKGNVQNVLHTDQELSLVSSVSVGIGSAPTKVITRGNFAYLLENGSEALEVYDVTNPQSPSVVSTFAFEAGSDPLSMDVSGKYAYVMQYGTGLLNILDVSSFASPVIVSTTTLPIGTARITVSGHYAYVADVTTGTMTVIDVSNVLSPQIMGSVALNGINPQNIHVYDHYAILTGSSNGYLDIVDISNPAAPVAVGNLLDVTSAVRDVQIQGHYAYGVGAGVLHVIDLTDPTAPIYYTNLNAGLGDYPFLSGRYLYLSNVVLDVINVVDVADPLNPVVISTTTVSGGSGMSSLFVDGRYLYTANTDTATFEVYDVHGAEFNGLSAHSAQVGTLQVLTNTAIANQLTVGGSLQVGGGILSLGSVGVAVDNNDYTNRLMVGGKNVCLEDGTNCAPSSSSYWTYDGVNDLLLTTTNSQAVMIGGVTTDTALFTADTANKVIILAAKNTQKVGIGTTTPAEQLDVVGNIRNVLTANQDFSVVQTLNPGTEAEPDDIAAFGDYVIMTLHGSSRIRIFNKSNITASGPLVSELTGLSGPRGVSVQGNYAYVIADSFLYVIDISNPGTPTLVSTTSVASGRRIVASGRYAYVAGSTSVTIYDISNPALLSVAASYALPGFSGARDIAVQGTYAYVAGSSPSQTSGTLYILNIANPAAPILSSSYSIGSGFGPTAEMFVDVQGSYAYMTRSTGSVNDLYVIGVSTATSPVLHSTVSLQKRVRGVRVSGRYAYVADADAVNQAMLDVVDVADPENPIFLKGVDLGTNGQPKSIAISGRYAFVTRPQNHVVSVVDIHGIETNGLMAGSALVGNLVVQNDAQFSNSLAISGGLTIGNGGIQSVGALAIASTNTTSTIALAVSSTAGEFSKRLTVGGVNVCLQDGTNCSGGGGGNSFWSYDDANDLLYTSTPTQDVIMGGDTRDNALFVLDQVGNPGGATNTILLGGSTTTYVGIGTSTPVAALDVVGQVNNLLQSGSDMALLSEIDYGGGFTQQTVVDGNTMYALVGSQLHAVDITDQRSPRELSSTFVFGNEMRVIGNIAYVYGADSSQLSIVDVSDPSLMQVVGTYTTSTSRGFDIVGKYAYLNAPNGVTVVDISSSTNPVYVNSGDVGANQFTNGGAVHEHNGFLYVFGNAGFAIFDIRQTPEAPVYVTSSSQFPAYDFKIQGSQAYLVDFANGLSILDLTQSATPTLMANIPADTGSVIAVSGRYAFTNNQSQSGTTVYDISSSTNPIALQTIPESNPNSITVAGNKLILGYLRFFFNPYNIRIHDIAGIETASLVAHSAEVGNLNVVKDVQVAQNVTVGGSLFVGNGGLFSKGAGEFSQALRLNGVNVCLQDGTNCPVGGSDSNWTYDSGTNLLHTATTTQDVVIGDTTYPGGLDGMFTLNGNDLYVAGQIGSNEGIFSATSVVVGSSTFYGDGYVNYMSPGDFYFNTIGTSTPSYVFSSEGFELSVPPAGWAMSGDAPWFQDGSTSTEGSFSASVTGTGLGVNPKMSSDIVFFPQPGFVTFDWQTNMDSFGSFSFCVDNDACTSFVADATINGVHSWDSVSVPVTAGSHQFYWTYQSSYFTNGVDQGWVDNVSYHVATSTQYGGYHFVTTGVERMHITDYGVDIYNGLNVTGDTNIYSGLNVQNDAYFNSNLYVQGQLVCLQDGTNCGSSFWSYDSANDALHPTTSTQAVYINQLHATDTFTNILHSGTPLSYSTTTVGTNPEGVAVQGRYAYVTNSGSGSLSVVDTSPIIGSPVVVGTVSGLSGFLQGLVVSGRYAYVVNDTGLLVVDISNPAAPTLVGSVGALHGSSGVALSGQYAYVTSYSDSAVYVVDVSNASKPAVVATVAIGPGGSSALGIDISGRYAYVTAFSMNYLAVIDIANPLAPVLMGSVSIGNGSERVVVQGRYAYTTSLFDNNVTIIDVADPTAPVVVSTAPVGTGPVGLAVSGRYVYTADRFSDTVSILDVVDPTSPVSIATIAAGDAPHDLKLAGRFVYFTNDNDNTLSVMDIGKTEVNGLVAHAADLGNLHVLNSANINNQLFIGGSLEVGTGGISSQGSLAVTGNIRNMYNEGLTQVGTVSGQYAQTLIRHGYLYGIDSNNYTLEIVDIKNPALPELKSSTALSSNNLQGMAWNGDYLMMTSNTKMVTVDVSNATGPIFTSMDVATTTGLYPVVANGYLYAPVGTKLKTFDVRDPFAPVLVSSVDGCDTGYADPALPIVDHGYLYLSCQKGVTIFSLQNPDSPILVSVLQLDSVNASIYSLDVSRDRVYVGRLFPANVINVIDVSEKVDPFVLATSTFASTFFPTAVKVAGDELYVLNGGAETLNVVDITSSTNPVNMSTTTLPGWREEIQFFDHYVYLGELNSDGLIYDLGGVQTKSVEASLGQLGSLFVRQHAQIDGSMMLGGDLTVYGGGIRSYGALNVSATNTTSTFLGAVSSTAGEFSNRLTVGGVNVCLQDGTNCPVSGGSFWSYDNTNNVLYTTTPTQDVLMGGDTTSSALFVVDYRGNTNTATNTILLGGVTTTFVGIGTSTPSVALDVVGNIRNVHATSQTIKPVYFSEDLGLGLVRGVTVIGHVAYVISEDANRLYLLDVSNSAAPSIISSVVIPNGAYAVAVDGRYAATISNSDEILTLIDISNPSSPTITATTTVSNPIQVAIQGRYIYVTNNFDGNLEIFDMVNPTKITRVGSVDLGTSAAGLYVKGRYAYVTGISNSSVFVVDIENPAAPVLRGSAIVGSQPIGVWATEENLYVTNRNSDQLNVLSITNPSAPVVIATATTESFPTGVNVQGSYAYVTNYLSETLQVFDITSSTNPISILSTNVGGSLGVAGNFISGKYAYISGYSGSTFGIFDLGGIETIGVNAESIRTGSLNVLSDAYIANSAYISSGLNVGMGGIYTAGSLGVFTSSTAATSTTIYNYASNTQPVLQVIGGCDNGTSSTAATLFLAGNLIDQRKFSVFCNGTVAIDGSFNTGGADYAEYFLKASSTTLPAGTAVSFDSMTTSSASVVRSQASLREKTVGIVSTRPGFIGNMVEGRDSDPSYVAVALTGQVPAFASGTIALGDKVMASDDGLLVKAVGPGTILGTAMTGLGSGTGTITVLLNVQWWAGDLLSLDEYGNAILKNKLVLASDEMATASSTLIDSPYFTFTGKAWDTASSTMVTHSYQMFVDMLSVSSSLFTVANASGTAMLTLSNEGDLTVHGKLYLANKSTQSGSTSTYLFIDDTAPSSTMISTNADGFQAQAAYDYAERYPSQENLQPGDLVTFDASGPVNSVKRTTASTDAVFGIVSTKPGFLTGAYVTGTYPIALAGRVPTRVTASNGEIHVGDALTSSDIPGVAMKATQPGIIVGYALEAYAGAETGLVQVFVKTGYFGGTVTADGKVQYAPSVLTQKIEVEGLATITSGSQEVKVRFESLKALPTVYVTPGASVDGGWWIADKSDTGFTIVLEKPQTHDVEFSWMARPMQAGVKRFLSDTTFELVDPLTGKGIPDEKSLSEGQSTNTDITVDPPSGTDVGIEMGSGGETATSSSPEVTP